MGGYNHDFRKHASDLFFPEVARRPARLGLIASARSFAGSLLRHSWACAAGAGIHPTADDAARWIPGSPRFRASPRNDAEIERNRRAKTAAAELPEHVLQHALLDHRRAVQFDRGAHHRQIEVAGGVAAGEFVGAG